MRQNSSPVEFLPFTAKSQPFRSLGAPPFNIGAYRRFFHILRFRCAFNSTSVEFFQPEAMCVSVASTYAGRLGGGRGASRRARAVATTVPRRRSDSCNRPVSQGRHRAASRAFRRHTTWPISWDTTISRPRTSSSCAGNRSGLLISIWRPRPRALDVVTTLLWWAPLREPMDRDPRRTYYSFEKMTPEGGAGVTSCVGVPQTFCG